MQFDIQASDFSLTDAFRNYTVRRLRYALSAKGDQIQRVIVRLSNISGPRGVAYKRCHIQVVLEQLDDVTIEDIETDLYTAIDRGTERAGNTVERRLARERDKYRPHSKIDIQLLTEVYELA